MLLRVTRQPNFQETWIFKLILFALLSGIAYLAIHYYIKQQKKKKAHQTYIDNLITNYQSLSKNPSMHESPQKDEIEESSKTVFSRDEANESSTSKIPSLHSLNLQPGEKNFMQQVVQCIEDNLSKSDFDLELLAGEMAMSKSTLHRKIKNASGLTPLELIRNIQLKRACRMLEARELTISEIAYSIGFSTPKYFTKCFKEEFGITPSEYQQQHTS